MTLKELRKSKGLTQEETSKICSIPLRTYKRLENDSSYINTYKYKSILSILDRYQSSDSKESYHILVIGAGYVGLSLGVLLSTDNDVSIVDINKDKVDKINKRLPIFKDKEIEEWLSSKSLNLKAYLPDISLYKDKDYIIISIPTDYDNESGLLSTNNITKLVKKIRSVNKSCIIVIKSTCYIGYTETLNDKGVIFSPEFLREGKALLDNLYPSRIIIGGDKSNPKVKRFARLLQGHTLNRAKTLFMSAKDAEAVKLFSNAYLALRVAYFNELDSYAISSDINSKNVIEGMSLDPRIGDYYNNPSFGYGGYCLPKDTLSLISQLGNIDNNHLISSIDRSNKSRKAYIVKDILAHLKDIPNPVVGIYSLESKKGSGNIRYSSIQDVITGLESSGIKVIYLSDMSIEEFKKVSNLILTNRYDSQLDDVKDKVYTRDVFARD